ncbi:MAG: DUF58 domain-containing protein [Lentisphaerae bacterium]|nr:DUF58 domain-containing protein [Lentisphaerota bacterium]MCP4103046.1 DUF58 domain-containing protein [Lentisphaerota bacterium]
MLPSELIAQVRKIEIRTRRMVDDIIGGAYHSVFKGSGIEFDEVREYTEEDDVRNIDWNVTARMGTPYIKKYVEERELNVMLLVDVSASSAFGSGQKSKRNHAVETAALLAFSAIRNNDRVGLIMFSDQTELYLPPRSGRKHGLRLIRELMAFKPSRKGTNIDSVLQEAIRVLNKRTVIFLISDLIDDNDFEKSLKIVNRRHDVIAVRILDPHELYWPAGVNIMVEDAETGETVAFNGRNRKILAGFEKISGGFHDKKRKLCDRAKVDMIDIRCGDDLVKPLVKFFNTRRRRR